MADDESGRQETGKPETTIIVNNKPVTVLGSRLSGLEIKEAAIAQGLPIKASFVLSELEPNGRAKIIGDADIVTVNKNSKFTANDDDDDS